MCGIVGYVSLRDEVQTREKEEFLRDALILDTFRGFDSTGLITVANEFDVFTHKDLLEGWDFVRTQEYADMPCGWAAIGHNRAATKGKVIAENAHPFHHNGVTLVHNGTLTDMGYSLPNFCSKQDVDSLNIARALGHVDPEEAIGVLKYIRGAYALAWTDERDQSVNIVRNGQRPLHFAHNSAKSTLWFMSDGRHLEMLKRRGWCTNADMGQVWQFNTHTLFKFKQGQLKPEVTKYDPFVQRPVYQGADHWPSVQRPSSTTYEAETRRSTPKGASKPPKERSSHRIHINGSLETVPEGLKQDLSLAMELSPDDSLQFEPMEFVPYPNTPEFGMVLGKAYIPAWESEWDCAVHSVNIRHANKVKQEYWEVMPYAVTEQMPGPSTDCYGIMAKIRKFDVAPWICSGSDADKDEDDKEGDTLPPMLLGPYGMLYSPEDWLQLTARGCGNCSCDFDPHEHDEIWWTGEMEKDPLCEDCVKEITQCDEHERMKEVMFN